MTKKQCVYRIIFAGANKIYEIYARHIYQSDMMGFLEVEDMLFGEQSSMVIDPSVEKLQIEFDGVTRTYIPMQDIVRIDEVAKLGQAKLKELPRKQTNVATFPMRNNVVKDSE